MSQSIFSYYYDPNICVDTSGSSSTINFQVHLQIFNQSGSTLYFKLTQPREEITPSSVNLGSVGAYSNAFFTPSFSVSKPAEDTILFGYWKIEAFTDSNYSNKVTEATKYTEVRLFDFSTWNTLLETTFDDGTSQGWTLSGTYLTNAWSVNPGGCSVYRPYVYGYTGTSTTEGYLRRTISLPDATLIYLTFYTNSSVGYNCAISFRVLCDSTEVYGLRRSLIETSVIRKHIVNLSSYRNSSRQITIYITTTSTGNYESRGYVDNIRISYKS